ncbi:MAG: GNAT family N-acetyltransferase, partial [Hyphomicrobiales bacterium]
MSLLEPPTAVHTRPSRKGTVRPMTGADVPEVARLFLKVFRGADRPADQELQHYLCTLALASPSHDEMLGTQIYEQQDGRIRSALLAVPMRF